MATADTFSDPKELEDLFVGWKRLSDQANTAARELEINSSNCEALFQEMAIRVSAGRWSWSGWNIFEVLGRIRLEDAHNDALAWLLKPWEAHGLGDRFIRDFVQTATGESLPNSRVRCVESRKGIGTERKIIDIEVRGDGWVLAVENKIGHQESPGQTESYGRYYYSLRKLGVRVFAVFLTLHGDLAQCSLFKSMNYASLRNVLERHRDTGRLEGSGFVGWFADHLRKDLETGA